MWHHFNPHHRTGGDDTTVTNAGNVKAISIHTTARVVTGEAEDVTQARELISIHTTARVVTEGVRNKLELALISIHTTARVVTWRLLILPAKS